MLLKRLRILQFVCVLGLAAAGTAHAAQQQTQLQLPPAFSRVVDCRAIADEGQRLACYDREVTQLQQATARNEIVIVDRDQIRKTRRTLFGLTLPNLAIFGGTDDEADGVTSIDTTLTRVSETPDGKWVLTLQEGGTWVQTDSRELIEDPRPGSTITIRRAALGSYLANVQKQRAIRVKRIQ